MPETSGMPDHSGNFIARWVMEGAAEDYGLIDGRSSVDEDPDTVELPEPIAGNRRSRRTAEKIAAVIAEATGQDLEDLDLDTTDMDAVADVINHDLTDPQSAWQALDATLSDRRLTQGHPEPAATDEQVRQAERTVERIERTVTRVKAGESDRRWVLRDIEWRTEKGLPPKKKKPSPNRSPERRRLERMRAKARHLGISVEEADAMTPRVSAMSSSPQETSPHGIDHPDS